jgi:hypothetical protein
MLDDVQYIIAEVSSWDNIAAVPHRFGGVEFTLGDVEIGHVHNFGLVDIPFTRKIREQLIEQGDAEDHHILPESGWISFYLGKTGDVGQALRLFKISYIQKSKSRNRRDPQRLADLNQMRDAMNLNDALRKLI